MLSFVPCYARTNPSLWGSSTGPPDGQTQSPCTNTHTVHEWVALASPKKISNPITVFFFFPHNEIISLLLSVDATLQTVPTCFSVAYATVDSLRTDCGFSAPHPRSRRHGRDHQVNLIPSVCPRLPCVFFWMSPVRMRARPKHQEKIASIWTSSSSLQHVTLWDWGELRKERRFCPLFFGVWLLLLNFFFAVMFQFKFLEIKF